MTPELERLVNEDAGHFEVQTRDDAGDIRNFRTLAEALTWADAEPGVWKISFPLASGERCRLIRDRRGTFQLSQMEDAIAAAVEDGLVSLIKGERR